LKEEIQVESRTFTHMNKEYQGFTDEMIREFTYLMNLTKRYKHTQWDALNVHGVLEEDVPFKICYTFNHQVKEAEDRHRLKMEAAAEKYEEPPEIEFAPFMVEDCSVDEWWEQFM
jgi:hypothetical protein